MTYQPGTARAADLTGYAKTSDVNSALANKANVADLVRYALTTGVQALRDALDLKSDASAVAGALALKADVTALLTKADSSTVSDLAARTPVPSTVMPKAESTAAAAGVRGVEVSGADHQHPRLTSTTYGTIGSTGTATVNFTRSFTNKPGVVITEVEGAATQPAVFKVESWVMTSGAYSGCVVRAWRAQVMPTLTPVSGILTAVITGVNAIVAALSQFNIFAAPAVGTGFSIIAIQRSDVT